MKNELLDRPVTTPADFDSHEDDGVRRIPLGFIAPAGANPRHEFDDEALADLIVSVQLHGVLQAITVRPVAGDQVHRYEIVLGERRYRAAVAVGLPTIPARIVEIDDETALLQAISENLHRDDLKPLEIAKAWQQLISQYGYTQGRIAEKFRKTQSIVSQTIGLLSLPAATQALIADRKLTGSHGAELAAMKSYADDEAITAFAARAVEEGWSVKRLRSEADALFESQQPKMDLAPEAPPEAQWQPQVKDQVDVVLKDGSVIIGIVNGWHVEHGFLVSGDVDGTRISQYFPLSQLRPTTQTTIADFGAPLSAEVDSPTAVSDPADEAAPDSDADDTDDVEEQASAEAPESAPAPEVAPPAITARPSTPPTPVAAPAPAAAAPVTPAPAESAFVEAMIPRALYSDLETRGLWPIKTLVEAHDAAVKRAEASDLHPGASFAANWLAEQGAVNALMSAEREIVAELFDGQDFTAQVLIGAILIHRMRVLRQAMAKTAAEAESTPATDDDQTPEAE